MKRESDATVALGIALICVIALLPTAIIAAIIIF